MFFPFWFRYGFDVGHSCEKIIWKHNTHIKITSKLHWKFHQQIQTKNHSRNRPKSALTFFPHIVLWGFCFSRKLLQRVFPNRPRTKFIFITFPASSSHHPTYITIIYISITYINIIYLIIYITYITYIIYIIYFTIIYSHPLHQHHLHHLHYHLHVHHLHQHHVHCISSFKS